MTTPEIKPIMEAPQSQSEVGGVAKEIPSASEAQIQPPPGPFQVQSQVQQTPQQQTQPADDANIITINVPATPQQLEDWAKGSPDSSLTWYAFYWIRMIKKALLHGYRVMTAQPAI